MDKAPLLSAPVEANPSVLGWLLRRVYCGNPFYVISADLVFVGLRMSLDTSGKSLETWALMLSLLGYTLLLATVAYVLIHLGNVWDDVRTLLLLVVGMFLAISVTFDETLARNPRLGVAFYLGGLLFAVAVSEGLLRGIRLRLSAFYRAPYYLILSLFFLYPVALTPLLGDPDNQLLQWALFGFSTLAGAAFLSLIPAVRRGAGYVAKNGSPWRYPLYPWVLFGLLGGAVCGRASYLCISFHYVGKSDTIFGPYFLVPFLFAVVLLVLEAGIVSRNGLTQRVALIGLSVLPFLAMAGPRHDPVYQSFLSHFMGKLGGSPLFLTLLAVAAAHAVAVMRRVPFALGGMTAALLALAVVRPGTLDLGGLAAPHPLVLAVVAALQISLALAWKESWRCLLGAACLVVALTAGAGFVGLGRYEGLIAFHLALVTMMVIGVLFDDPLGRFLQGLAAVEIAFTCTISVWLDPITFGAIPPGLVWVHPVAAAASSPRLTAMRAEDDSTTRSPRGGSWDGQCSMAGSRISACVGSLRASIRSRAGSSSSWSRRSSVSRKRGSGHGGSRAVSATWQRHLVTPPW